MKIKTQNVDIDFELPDDYTDVGIRISGGLDSAILLYILCTYITETQRDIKVFPMTSNDWKKPYQVEFATRVLNWTKERFPNIYFHDHNTHQIAHGDDYIEGQLAHKISALRGFYAEHDRKINIVLHGQNLAPPLEVQQTFIHPYGDPLNGPNPNDNRNELQDPWVMEKLLYRPLINLNKQGIAEIYEHYDLMDTLFNVTRSCECANPEKTNNFTSHCQTDCWWCHERKWGFGKI